MTRCHVVFLGLALAGCNAPSQLRPNIAAGPNGTLAENSAMPDSLLTHGDAFVAIQKQVPQATLDERRLRLATLGLPPAESATGGQDFYIAINKRELGTRWFLSAYLKELFPGAVSYGAARSLGTQVVSFKVQNDRLYMFLADDLRKTSETFDPETIVDAYPIVDAYSPFDGLAGASDYVLFDPSQGLSRYDLLSDAFAGGAQPAHFELELAFLQRFRSLADGATFEKVFTGYSADQNVPIGDGTLGEANVFRASGTLGMSLRRYQESPGFTAVSLPLDDNQKPVQNYFLSDSKIVPDTGTKVQTAVHWNIHPGMKPIEWVISNQFLDVQKQFPQYDVVGAIKAGIENWNQLFGYKVLEARVATSDESDADDDTNYLIYDGDPTFGAAFADWRTNPNTGEIRGASVYFNAIWLTGADQEFTDTPPTPVPAASPAPAQPAATQKRPHIMSLAWEGMPENRLCTLFAPAFRSTGNWDVAAPAGGSGALLTKKQKVEAFLTHVVLHEIGHTLGLRHNFKGSLEPVSSSVMDYLLDRDAITMTTPGPYDIDAIKYLYGMSDQPAKQLFCTDEDVAKDPLCKQFDTAADPLNDYFGKAWKRLLPGEPDGLANGLIDYVRAGATSDVRVSAWTTLIGGIGVSQIPASLVAAQPNYAPTVDALERGVLELMYLDDVSLRGDIKSDVPGDDAALNGAIAAELKAIVLNADGYRSFESRRQAVQILKKMQNELALGALLDAQTGLKAAPATTTSTSPPATATDANDLADLEARIATAVQPYYADYVTPAPVVTASN